MMTRRDGAISPTGWTHSPGDGSERWHQAPAQTSKRLSSWTPKRLSLQQKGGYHIKTIGNGDTQPHTPAASGQGHDPLTQQDYRKQQQLPDSQGDPLPATGDREGDPLHAAATAAGNGTGDLEEKQAHTIGPMLTRRGTPRKRKPYRQRRDTHSVKFQERDEWLMAIIAMMGGMRYDQIGTWLAFFAEWREMKAGKKRHMIQGEDGEMVLAPLVPLTENAVRRVIGRWFVAGYAAADKLAESDRIGDRHFWLWMTDAYMAEYGLPFDGSRPPKKMLKHLYQTNEVRLTLARSTKFPRHVWISERAITASREEAMPGVPFEHPPDGVLQFEDGSRAAIEVERSIKDDYKLEQILLDLLENYDEVYYFTTEATEPVIERARSLLNTDQQERITIFAVLTN